MYHPVPVKSGNETCCVGSNLLSFVAEFEKCSVAVNEPGRIGERYAEVEGLDELKIGMTKFENVNLDNGWTWSMYSGREAYLQNVREVD